MVKLLKNFRLEKETLEMMDTLIPFLSSEKNIKLDRTKLIEVLVADRYAKLLEESKND